MTWEQVVAILALLLAVVAVVVGVVVLRRMGKTRQHGREAANAAPAPTGQGDAAPSAPPAIVINPTRTSNVEALRMLAGQLCAELGLPEPLWFETTADDPGAGQARQALARGASVVIAAGGDGTVRAVASALAGSSTPMGLLPLGTANLLARNLDLPPDGNARSLLTTALTGTERSIDLGWIRPVHLHPSEPPIRDDGGPRVGGTGSPSSPAGGGTPDEEVFLVMAGVGFDAAMVAGAGEQLKARMGWSAYFVAGARHLHGRKVRVEMRIADEPPIALKLRSLLFANCGRLPAGMVLLPDAQIDDGWLDIAAIDTRGGLLGWASLLGKVVMQGVGVRRQLPGQPGSIEFWRGRQIEVRCEQPGPIQVDGDLLGDAVGLDVRIQPAGLIVRTR